MDKFSKNKNADYKRLLEGATEDFCPFRKEFQMEVLESFLAKDFKGKRDLAILEACSGQGRLLYYLNQFDNNQQYTGFDFVSSFVEQANELFKDDKNVQCFCADIYGTSLSKKYNKAFDITILYKTLAWLPDYQQALETLFNVTDKKIYITTPLYDGNIDYEIKIKPYTQLTGSTDHMMYYIYSMQRIEKYCKQLGAKEVAFHDLKLPFDLPDDGNKDHVRTYTFRTKEDEIIEMTNIIKLDWKLIEIVL